MTKREMISKLIPIELYGKFSEETINKSIKNWSKNGLDKLITLRHTYWDDSAHNIICATVICAKERNINWNKLEKVLGEQM